MQPNKLISKSPCKHSKYFVSNFASHVSDSADLTYKLVNTICSNFVAPVVGLELVNNVSNKSVKMLFVNITNVSVNPLNPYVSKTSKTMSLANF